MQSIVGVAGGATRAALTQHQARRDNMADVSAKDGSQVNKFLIEFKVLPRSIRGLSIDLVTVVGHNRPSTGMFMECLDQ